MKRTHKRVTSFISAALIIVFAMPISAFIVSANDTTKGLDGKVYEFSKKNDYEVSDDNYTHKCTECGHKNSISKDNIYLSHADYGNSQEEDD